MDTGNLLQPIPALLPDELFEDIVKTDGVRIERIVSRGHCSEEDDWYNQDEHEWVMVVQGEAVLHFEQGNRKVRLNAGMHIDIPAHCRHRVDWTTPDTETIWLAVFYRDAL